MCIVVTILVCSWQSVTQRTGATEQQAARASPVIVAAALISASIVAVFDAVAEPIRLTDLVTEEIGDAVRRILDVVDGVVPPALDAVANTVEALVDILRNVFNFLHLSAGPTGCVVGKVHDVLPRPVEGALGAVLVAADVAFEASLVSIPPLFYIADASVSRAAATCEYERARSLYLPTFSPSCISSAPPSTPAASPAAPYAML